LVKRRKYVQVCSNAKQMIFFRDKGYIRPSYKFNLAVLFGKRASFPFIQHGGRNAFVTVFKLKCLWEFFKQGFMCNMNKTSIIQMMQISSSTTNTLSHQLLNASYLTVSNSTWDDPFEGRQICCDIKCQAMIGYPARHSDANSCQFLISCNALLR